MEISFARFIFTLQKKRKKKEYCYGKTGWRRRLY